jgi:hypothetical protein
MPTSGRDAYLRSLPASSLAELDALLADVAAMVPRGAVRRLWHLPPDAHEVIVAGPAETGKTYGCLQWLHEQLLAHPRADAIMVRRQYTDMAGSCVKTYTEKVLRWPDFPTGASPEGVTVFGGNLPKWFQYPNGSRLSLVGMDNPGDALSSERDYIYANQAEELAARDWQVLLTRATGRAGHVPAPRVLGDANPGPPGHWILRRAAAGRLLRLDSRHQDNPALFDDAGNLTAQGRRTMGILDGLEGVERDRLRDGLWVAAEGTVYTLLPEHLGDNLYQRGKPVELAIDPNNGAGPYATLVIQPSLERVCVVDEYYVVGGTDEGLAEWLVDRGYAVQTTAGVVDAGAIRAAVCDPAKPETVNRLTCLIRGLHVPEYPGRKEIAANINAVRALMRVDPALHRAQLVVDRERCLYTIEEFGQYVWARPPASDPERNVPQQPADKWNHCMDGLGYWTIVRRPVASARPAGLAVVRQPESPWYVR